MKATAITIERVFFLGAAGQSRFPESIRVGVSWSLENETVEEAEEKIIQQLYEVADRERKRRWLYLKVHSQEKQAREAAVAVVGQQGA